MVEIQKQRLGQVKRLAFKGRMDAASREQMINAIEQELEAENQQIVLDLSAVTYLSTSGLKVMSALEKRNHPVRIAGATQRVRELLEATGLDKVYNLYETAPEAIHTVTPVVNAHTHLELGWLNDYRPGVSGEDFFPWLGDKVGRTGQALGDTRFAVSEAAAERAIVDLEEAGTTVVHDVSPVGASISPLMRSGLQGVVYIEVLGAVNRMADKSWEAAMQLFDRWRSKERRGMKLGLSVHTPYTATPELWTKALDFVRKEDLPLCIHVAESKAEYDFCMTDTGPIADWLRNVSLSSPKKSPVHYLEDIGALDLKPLLIHAVQVDDADIQRIKNSGSTVVHCPRSNLRLKCGRMPLEKYLAAGVPVYLGTDSLGSSPSLNVLDELEFAVALHYGKVAPQQIEQMVYTPLPATP